MSNVNTIIATAADTHISATSYNGSTWVQKTLPSNQTWKMIGGTTGKFIYYLADTNIPYSKQLTTITDNVHWKLGSLPTASTSIIVILADGEGAFYTSTDGNTFAKISTPSFTHYVVGAALSTSTSKYSRSTYYTRQVVGLAVASTSAFYRVTRVVRKSFAALSTSVVSILNKANNI